MNIIDIIKHKRDKGSLSNEEIQFFVTGATNNTIKDYQIASLLMAIFLNGMTKQETVALTKAMMLSGETIDLSEIEGIKVDKHSTGGVGDKTTIVLMPLVASVGVKVAKMTGRGLGHTGGTMDKFDCFKGLNMELDKDTFVQNVKQHGIAITGQSKGLVPADKKLYALRDVTGTIESIPLIAASVMSKKLASGSDAIVLDVKSGSGAFMKNEAAAFALANELVAIGHGMGKNTVALVSNMDEPLGHAIGNSLEVIEAIETLQGNGPNDLVDVCLKLGAIILVMAQVVDDHLEAEKLLQQQLHNGKALEKFKEFIASQGGDANQVDNPSTLPRASHSFAFNSKQTGYVSHLDAETIGTTAMLLGAGRKTKEDSIDLAAGIYLHKKIGDRVQQGETLATLYYNDAQKLPEALESMKNAYRFTDTPPSANRLILGMVQYKAENLS
jgi:pyrimidine-nucleoside phosphorylase